MNNYMPRNWTTEVKGQISVNGQYPKTEPRSSRMPEHTNNNE